MWINFIIVEGNGSPSVLGCKQSQELGVITVNIHDIESGKQKKVNPCNTENSCQEAAEKGILTKSQLLDEYKDCFDKIGRFPHDRYHIQLKDNAQPVVHPPRTVPVHILPLYKKELENMIANDVVEPVTQPTDWVNSIVCNVTKTSDGKQKVRLCLDPKDLNKNINREHYYSRTIDGILPKLHAKKYFSVVDTKRGFWHVELDDESSLLCTFNTPFGRHRFKRLAFGTCVSQDIFQKKLDDIFQNIPNVTGIADDIIVYGETPEEHDKSFIKMLNECRKNNIGLNSEKLRFKQRKLNSMDIPCQIKEYNHLRIIESDKEYKITGKCKGIAHHPRNDNISQQIFNENCRIISTAEKIDKEKYHSPLEQIFKKNIVDAPARLQRLLLKCLKFDVTVKYKQGIKIPVADALSRRVIENEKEKNSEQYKIHFMVSEAPPINLEVIKQATDEDMVCNKLKEIIYKGWPDQRKQCPQELWDYWNFRCDLVLENSLIVKGNRIVVPSKLRSQVLNALHSGLQGETECLLLARQSVFWPGITKNVTDMVKSCELCNKYHSAQAKMPMMKPDLPSRPWKKLGTDIFEFQGKKYLMIVDYFQRFPVVRKLQDMTAESVCEQFSNVLAEYGLCSTILADFGSQYVSQLFRGKCDANGITMSFSSPYHHQANSLAERAIGTCKLLWKKAKEEGKSLESSLWIYRVTPLDYQTPSPFELLFGRKPRTFMPLNERSLQSKSTELEKQQEINENKQVKQKEFYDRKASLDRRPLSKNEDVYVWNDLRRIWEPGKIENIPNPVREPRTYTVLLNSKLYRRTREHLKPRIAANKSKYNEKKI
uniref:uncharacterized protein K02A2.6-like n=1 Tax=Styela clava TaxID=7725 RepID=UPI001939B220|nr:uncharacterized protein K02A2.6-like [Styela clava]